MIENYNPVVWSAKNKMVKRREVQNEHEKAGLKRLGLYLDGLGSSFKMLANPDPPDAIVEIDGKKTWVEITDAFFDEDLAISETTYASEDKKHIPHPKSGKPIANPKKIFQKVLHEVIEKKYDKKTMKQTYAKYGQGILLVCVHDPFSTSSMIARDEKQNISALVSQKTVKIFNKIYVYDCYTPDLNLLYP